MININLLFYTFLFCTQYFLPVNIAIPTVAISLSLFLFYFQVNFKNKYINPLIFVFTIGITGIFDHESRDIYRDILYCINPILLFLYGYYLYGVKNFEKIFFKFIIFIGLISSIHYLIKFIINPSLLYLDPDEIRRLVSGGSDESILAICLLLFRKNFSTINKFIKNKILFIIVLSILLISFVLSFSRTSYIFLLIMILTLMGFTSNYKFKNIFYISIVLITVFIGLSVIGPQEEGTWLSKLQASFSELGITDYSNETDIALHWRGYEAYNTFQNILNSSILDIIKGRGFGARILIDTPLILDSENDYRIVLDTLPTLHNGYVYILFKTGIMGLIFYVYFYLKLSNSVKFNKNDRLYDIIYHKRFAFGMILSLAFMMLVIKGIAQGSNYTIMIILGYIIGKLSSDLNRE